MQYQEAYQFMINKLESGLPPYLSYHNIDHTKSVIEASEIIATREGIHGDELLLLKTAALFHDSGFLQDYQQHESISVSLAKKHLPSFGYTEEQIEKIASMIMATKLPQSPKDHLAKILCDADLYYLGGPDYTANADKLFSENKKIGLYKSKTEWLIQQIGFLTSHQYFTETAKSDLDAVKQQNLKKLEQTLVPSAEEKHKDSNWVIVQDAAQVLLGVVMAGIALKGFLVPNHFFDGGVTGMSLLAHELYHWNLALNIMLFNLPLVIISFFSVGKRFAVRMMLSVILLGICLEWLPELSLTHDKLLISIFGGAFLGTGIGLVMRAGAALDGIEVFALYTLKRTSFTITEIILAFNTLIFTIAAFKFGVETALYSILTYFTATRCIDYVVEGVQAYTGVTIISAKSDAIKYQLVNKLGRGITVYKGERGFLPGKFDVSAECDIIFTVITRLELRKLKNLISEVDPKAFIYASTIREASGGILKKIGRH